MPGSLKGFLVVQNFRKALKIGFTSFDFRWPYNTKTLILTFHSSDDFWKALRRKLWIYQQPFSRLNQKSWIPLSKVYQAL